ncbi:hypothetical protein [Altererythrobacter sp. GH1-8]|uniref:hypothetical protein n=1 Tax=Altererythrobacter sp. GH1-8 TaxID=3349333 RepID=UPI00374DA5B0
MSDDAARLIDSHSAKGLRTVSDFHSSDTESKQWGGDPDPWELKLQNGATAGVLKDINVVLYRTTSTNQKVTSFMTYSFTGSFSWRPTFSPIALIYLTDANDDRFGEANLGNWRPQCGAERRYTLVGNVDPKFYDIVEGWETWLGMNAGPWGRCP